MDNRQDWLRKLCDDLIEQFRGKPMIQEYNKAISRQLEELYAFFYQIYVLQWLDQAQGVQLDGIGNIVDMSRTDALIWSSMAGLNVPMNDDLYRLYLMFKIFLNTSEGTYKDIMRSLRMFFPDAGFFYSEYPEFPATMFFTNRSLTQDTDFMTLNVISRVKAAGVALRFIIDTEHDETRGEVNIAGYAFPGNSEVTLPSVKPAATFSAILGAYAWQSSQMTLPDITPPPDIPGMLLLLADGSIVPGYLRLPPDEEEDKYE